MDIARFALRNDKVVLFVTVVLAALGIRAYLSTPQSIFPTMSFARIDVVADAGDLPPARVRVAVSLPLETAFEALPNVTRVTANSAAGSSEIFVEFATGSDPRVDLEAVDQALAQVRSQLDAVKNVSSFVVDANKEPVLSYALTSQTLSQAVLRDLAQHSIQPRLFGIPGLGRTLIAGGPSIELHVDLDAASLAAHGLGAADAVKAIADASGVQTLGNLERNYQNYALVIDSSIKDAASLRTISVTDKNGNAVPLSSLGTIHAGVSPPANFASFDGRHAVTINAYPLQGADSVAMAAQFRERMAQIAHSLPSDVRVSAFWDQTTLIVESQRALRDAILLGALLAVLVIFAFLRNARLIAMAISIFALQLAGQTLNLMSVGGLAVAVGLIIDDAIVVIENIARTFRERPELSKTDAIRLATSQLGAPMAASTAATVVVFLPLSLLGCVPGYFFRALAFTLSTSLIVSLTLALFVAPNVARALFAGSQAEGRERRDFMSRVLDRYEPLLRWSLGHRVVLYAGAAATLVVTALLLLALPSDFLPKMDEGQFEITYSLPTGTTLAATDAASTRMENIVRADPAVASVGRLTAIDSDGVSPVPVNRGLLRVLLVAPNRRDGYDDVSARLRDALQTAIPASNFDFHQILEDLINDLSGTPAPVEIAIRGADQATLISLAGTVAKKIGTVDGIVDVASGITYDNPTLALAPNGGRLGALGLSASDVGDAVAARLQGIVATSIGGADRQIPVRVRVAGGDGGIVDGASLAKGGATSLDALARIATQRLASEESDENGQRIVRVTANIGNANLSAVTARLQAALATIARPPGYTFAIGGQSKSQAQSFSQFVTVIGIAVALVFSVMLATFRSYRLPLVILTAIPLALIGVALGLFITRTPFNVSSFMGLLLLVGIVVKNGILLIDVAQKARFDGASVDDALVLAGKTRLRPIVMTTLAAIGGLLPLAFGLGQGAEMERPLAIAVIGGLSTATIFTLVVIPVLYATFSDRIVADAPAPVPSTDVPASLVRA
jgi:multidrug efflux pump subunit AcrB